MSPVTRRALSVLWVSAATALLAWAFQRWVLSAPPGTYAWLRGGAEYRLTDPRPLGVLLVAPLLLFILGRSLADLPWQQRVLSVLFRCAFLLALGAGLGRLVKTEEVRRTALVAVVDVSDSISDEALEDARSALAAVLSATPGEAPRRLVAVARRAHVVELPADGTVPPLTALRPAPAADDDAPGAGTDLAAGLRLGLGLVPPGHLGRLVLFTDGRETTGDVVAEADRARALGARLHVVPLRRPPPAEVAVRSLSAPPQVAIGEPFTLTAVLWSSRATRARVRLKMGDVINALDGVRQLELQPGDNRVEMQSVVRVGGEVTYTLEADELGEDRFRSNNRFSLTLDVPARPSVLYVEGQAAHARYLAQVLTAQQFDVDVRSPSAFPTSLGELSRFQFVILSDVPREKLGQGKEELVERWVRDLGGGFLMAGGQSGFGLGGWGGSTLERLLPVRMDVQKRKELPSVAVLLVIDRSGSMSGLPLEMAKAACKATVSTLDGDDWVGVIAFDSQPTRAVRLQPARYRHRIQNDILRIQAGGGTEIFPALDAAYQDLSAIQARKKHVILLTDGRAPTGGLRELAQGMLAEGITVTTVGLGDGTDPELLRNLSEWGGGRYHHVPDPNNLPRIFTRETEMVARQAAVEDWFPVQVVTPRDYLRGVGVEGAPLLRGYVATELKPPPARLVLASDRGEPILAEWRVGLGVALAWTTDVKNLWAVEWLRWPGYGKLWGQMVRENLRRQHRREVPLTTEVVGDEVRVTLDAFTTDERFQNGLVSKLTLQGPLPARDERELPFPQVAPGRYEARFPVRRFGSYLLRGEHRSPDEDAVALRSVGRVTLPYPREYQSFEPDLERARWAAEAGGGEVDPAPAAAVAPGDDHLRVEAPRWHPFVLAAIALLLLDLLVRRVRLFDRGFRRAGAR